MSRVTFSAPETSPRRHTPPAQPVCTIGTYFLDASYLGKAGKHATVTGLATTIENLRHDLYVDNYFSFPDLFDMLCTKALTLTFI
jgi:hypothetical protein